MDLQERRLMLALDALLKGVDLSPEFDATEDSLREAGVAMRMGDKLRITPIGLQVLLTIRSKEDQEKADGLSDFDRTVASD